MIRLIAVLLTLAAPAQAQTPCTGLPDALAALAARYAEAPRVSALLPTGQLLIVMVNERGDWSMLRANPDGLACMAASGEGFGLIEAEAPGVDG